MDLPEQPKINTIDVNSLLVKRLKKYDKLNLLEQFGMFMGLVQILEIGLKNLLIGLFHYDSAIIDKWTMGQTARELENNGVRNDFIILLKSVVEYRNYIAHEFLGNEIMLNSILNGDSGRLERKHLDNGIIELEQILIIYEWCQQNASWK